MKEVEPDVEPYMRGTPLDCQNGGWGFWDETWGNWHGPYESKDAAEQALKDYAESL